MVLGISPLDEGHYIFSKEERDEFLKKEPKAKKYMMPFLDGRTFINGGMRYILALQDCPPNELRKMSHVVERVKLVKEFRSKSKRNRTKKLADTPLLYDTNNKLPDKSFLVIPRVSSEHRKYVPIDFIEPPTIPMEKLRIIPNATLEIFGLLTSKMHMIWLASIGGRLGTGFSYSTSVYNTFPVPNGNWCKLKKYAQDILDIRDQYEKSTMADLYDPDTMPHELLKAHHTLDKIVEKLYRDKPFKDDDERLEFLLNEYVRIVGTETTIEEYPT